jgi:hypothetical protein
MKHKFTTAVLLAVAAVTASAADTKAATELLTKAFSCDVKDGRASQVVKAIKSLGAKPGKDADDYILPMPLTVFGLPVTHVNITPSTGEGPDSYIAIFVGGKLNDIAAAASLKPLAGGFERDTKAGRLSADVRDHTNVWLACTPTTR